MHFECRILSMPFWSRSVMQTRAKLWWKPFLIKPFEHFNRITLMHNQFSRINLIKSLQTAFQCASTISVRFHFHHFPKVPMCVRKSNFEFCCSLNETLRPLWLKLKLQLKSKNWLLIESHHRLWGVRRTNWIRLRWNDFNSTLIQATWIFESLLADFEKDRAFVRTARHVEHRQPTNCNRNY